MPPIGSSSASSRVGRWAKRFGDGWKANSLFWELVEALKPIFDGGVEYEGQEFELFFTINGTRTAYCEEIYEEMYY